MTSDRDEIRSASKALKDAAAAFTRAIGETITEAGTQAGRELANELFDASRELGDAATRLRKGPAAARSAKAQRTRDDLLAAAAVVFAERGYDGASIDDVAKEAGYTKGAVYANFGSKSELFLAVARELAATDGEQDGTSIRGADLNRVLLVLEVYLHGLRNDDARPVIGDLVTDSYERYAQQLHDARSGEVSSGEMLPADAPYAGAPFSGATAGADPSEDAPERSDAGHADNRRSTPTQDDRDAALGIAAIHSFGAVLAALAPDNAHLEGAVRRLTARLLEG